MKIDGRAPAQSRSQTSIPRKWGAAFATTAATALVGVGLTPGIAIADDHTTMAEDNQWVLDQINAEKAWSSSKGEGVTVAVLDDGFLDHPLLNESNLLEGHDLVVPGNPDGAYNPIAEHGTKVIGSTLMVAPEATILPITIFGDVSPDPSGERFELDPGEKQRIEDGIRYAVDQGADIITTSFGSHDTSMDTDELLAAYQYAIDNNVVVVSAAGNSAGEPVGAPARYPGTVAVTGTEKDGSVRSSLTTGPEVTVAAPGGEQQCVRGDNRPEFDWQENEGPFYESCSGTSISTAIVSGAMALVLGANPDLDANNAINRLINTASNGPEGKNDETGYGIIDIDKAVNSGDLDTVEENPLGYPLGEAGLSETSPANEDSEEDQKSSESTEDSAADESDASEEDSNMLLYLLIGAAALIVIVAIVVWLILKNRNKPTPPSQGGNENFYGQVPPGSPQQPGSPQGNQFPPQGT
ncbi:S8 family serine peptidase [Salininema proteolyticum]|uniref:S8 family serine peptidase n=1 Tax=Salininema proteolyticum TaxID=1607685 RepID=A0ABV8TUZ9_9ACTN